MNLFIQISKYIFILLMLLYALKAYTCIGQKNARKRNRKLASQTRIMYIFVTLGFVIIFMNQKKPQLLLLMAGIWIYFSVTQKL